MTSEIAKKRPRNWRSARRRKFAHSSNDYRQVEKMFYCYKEIKQEVEEIRSEQGCYQSGHKEGGGSSNHAFISDPTSQLAIKHTEEIKKIVINAGSLYPTTISLPERWIFVVEQTLKYFKGEQIILEVIKRRYFKNEGYVRTCSDLDIENFDDYYEAKDEGLKYARDCAIQMGLIKVF